MACNLNEDRKYDRDAAKSSGLRLDGIESQEQLSASTTTTSKQNGDQAGCEDEQMSEQDACERRKSGLSDFKNCSTSPSALHRSTEEWHRKNFQIPRKIKERKGLLQHLGAETRELEELFKLLSSSYLDTSSRGAFTYTKAFLIHNELLEKEYIEKKRELKQAGRTDAELTDSYAFLLPDAKKTRWICEKGLSVGHARINNLGNPVKGVYLSKYSDLLKINPFEAGASGDIIIFKVMKGRLKSIFENTPKTNLEPTPKFDCHVHKNAGKVTSLLSYRAFELTQQYFYEFAFEELRSRPRHVCPYAVVSFQYKVKESATAAHRLNSGVYEGHRGWRRYTVWSGSLVNRGEELYHVCIRSPNLPFLPLKLPDKIDISMAMHLDQVRRKIPSTLLSWDSYSGTQEVMKCGMYCSLFDVMAKTKQGNSLSGLLHKMEKEKMVLVKPLAEKGFLLLLSSSHLHSSKEKRGRSDRGLQALFVFQEPRFTGRIMSRHAGLHVDSLVPLEPRDSNTEHIETVAPALHHAFYKLRTNPPKDLASAVKTQALDYLSLREHGSGRLFSLPEYRLSLDERPGLYPPQRPKNMDSLLNTYFHAPDNFKLAITCLQQDVEDTGPAMVDEYSPVSDWSGSGSTRTGLAQSNGGGAQKPQGEYDKDKMEKLLKLIQLHKRSLGKEDGAIQERSDDWEPAGHKRRPEGDLSAGASKYIKTDAVSNGELGRVPQGERSTSVSAVMDNMGICDTDLREHVSHTAPIQDTQTLLKLFITALKNVSQSTATAAPATAGHHLLPTQLQESVAPDRPCEPAEPPAHSEQNPQARQAEDEQISLDYLEDQMACSVSSMDLCSPPPTFEQQVQLPPEPSHNLLPWRAASMVPVPTDEPGTSGTSVMDRSIPAAGQTLDSILDQEFQALCTGIQDLMERHQIFYLSQPALPQNEDVASRPGSTFSPYVSKFISPLPVQGYISMLCEKMNHMISTCAAPQYHITPSDAAQPAPLPPPPPPLPPVVPPVSAALTAPPTVPPPAAAAAPAVVTSSIQSASKDKSQESLHKAASKPQTPVSTPTLTPTPAALPSVPKKQPSPTRKSHPEKKSDPTVPNVADSPKCKPAVSTGLPLIPEVPAEPAQTGAPGNDVISQIEPNVLSTLVEIMQMNAVRFYIQQGEEEENDLCAKIKRYLKSLGNVECSPLTYLESSCQQKFMVIIQNEDIASHVHKIPGLVSLKKLATVSFAGVDSLDDVKNRTYNELFMSGGLIVSDELILNPDFITLEKLQAFLQLLEEQSMPWKWKVHCKTQKKLKELSRSNSEALNLLNLLTAYQKKHLVEFLPYHECDAPSRQAPDLDCLVKLQAQHTQLRHIIFLTDKSIDVLKFSSNGIITASLNDIMKDFESLIIRARSEDSAPPVVPAPEPDACMDEEDMSLDSDEDAAVPAEDRAAEKQTALPLQPVSEDILPPISHPNSTDPLSSNPVDYTILKAAISQYKASKQTGTSMAEGEDNLASFGVNPHQSYLYPNSAQWSPYSGSPGYHMSSAYSSPACSTTQGQEYCQVNSMSVTLANPVPLSQTADQANLSSSCVNPPANTAPLGLSQTSCNKGERDPDGLSCPPALPQAQTQSHVNDSQPFLPGSQDTQTKAMETPALSLSSSSSVPCTLPSYPDAPIFPGPIPTPPAPPVYNWAASTGAQNSYVPGVSPAPFRNNEGAASCEGLCLGTGEGLTVNNKDDGSTSCTAPSSLQFEVGGTEKCTSGSVMPRIQGNRTSVNSCTESHRGGMMPARGMSGGGMPCNPRGLLPRPGTTMRPACRGGPHGPISHGGNRMFGPRGPIPGLMDIRRGGFRGRGAPPMPMRSRPGRGSMWGGTHCNRGYGPPKDYYSDYTY